MKNIYVITLRCVIYTPGKVKDYTVNASEYVYLNYEDARSRMYEIVTKKIKKNNYRVICHGNNYVTIHKYMSKTIENNIYGYNKYRYYKISSIKVK